MAEESNIMKVREIIDAAFGDDETNIVNFKYIQTVLFLLASQLRILERRVEVEFEPLRPKTSTTFSISEVKIHATKPRKKGKQKESKSGKSRKAKVGEEVTSSKGKRDKSYSKKSSPRDKTPSLDESQITLSSTDETSSSKEKTISASKDETSSTKEKTTSLSKDETSSSKEKTTSSSKEPTTTDQTTSSSKNATSSSKDATLSSKDVTSSSKEKTTSSSKLESTSSSKVQGTSSSKDKTSSSSQGQTSSSKEKTTSSSKDETILSSKEQTTSSSKLKSSSSSHSKSRFKQAESQSGEEDEGSFEDEVDSAGQKGGKSRRKKTTELCHRLLEKEEERREKVLRVINQRADSFSMSSKTPTPMASIASFEQQEKILVVERVPSSSSTRMSRRTPEISVVTKEQFEKLSKVVRELKTRLLPIGTPTFPEHAELMQELKRGASLTDAMAALQLSARLEAAEKAIDRIMPMITDLAKVSPETAREIAKMHKSGTQFHKMGRQFSRTKTGAPKSPRKQGSRPTVASGTSEETLPRSTSSHKSMEKVKRVYEPGQEPEETEPPLDVEFDYIAQPTKSTTEVVAEKFEWTPEFITHKDLDHATKEMNEYLMEQFKKITTRATTNAEQAMKAAAGLEGKIETALAASSRMANLEVLVSQYADQINALDTGLSSQMTNYQEQLTHMQHNLEIGLETMTEVLANQGGDTAAMAELNTHFTSLQTDFDSMMYRQKELQDVLDTVSYDLEGLWKQIEMLRATKSDREEVTDALRDKAGIGLLNGLVSLLQFDAVRGDLEKRVADAYDKFNNQELVWQKAIDDLLRELNEKADLIQVESLRDEINKYLNVMNERMQVIIDIVGEPKSAAVSKKLFRNAACLSCGSPAHMDIEDPCLVPALPKFRKSKKGEEPDTSRTAKGDGDHSICYPGLPIRHPRDPRSHICQRYCGGSHTVVNEPPCKMPPSLAVKPMMDMRTQQGTDGKMYLVDTAADKVPCAPCNTSHKSPPPSPILLDMEKGSAGGDGDIATAEDTKEANLPEHKAENITDVPVTTLASPDTEVVSEK